MQISSTALSLGFGSNVVYASVHEYGYKGIRKRPYFMKSLIELEKTLNDTISGVLKDRLTLDK